MNKEEFMKRIKMFQNPTNQNNNIKKDPPFDKKEIESSNNQNKIIENTQKVESSNNQNKIVENTKKLESLNNQNKIIENTEKVESSNNQNKIIENTEKVESSNNQNKIIENTKKDDTKHNNDKLEKIYFYLYVKEDPLKKYPYFKKFFCECFYIFVVPRPFFDLFEEFYSIIINDSVALYVFDFETVKLTLDKYEKEKGITENWIVIAPCLELKKNIKAFHQNKNIYRFIGYCPDYTHNHDEDLFFFWKFPKFRGIESSAKQLIETLFKLSNIFYYRKKQNYEIVKDDNIIELKYDRNILIGTKNECSKNHVMCEKYVKFFNFTENDDESYFAFINLFTLLDRSIEEKDTKLLYI